MINTYKHNISSIYKENQLDFTRYKPKNENKLKFQA